MKSVSVIVICYNHEKYVIECLNSIINQNIENIDLIIGDDGSNDNSQFIISQYLESKNIKAKKIFHEKNKGKDIILNECLNLATGKYVSFIAADDYMIGNRIHKQVEIMDKLGEEYGLIYGDFKAVSADGTMIYESKFKNILKDEAPPQGNIFPMVLEHFFIWPLTTLIRLDLLKNYGFRFDKKIISEDWDIALHISRISKIAAIQEIIAAYRILETSVSRTTFIDKKVHLVQKSNIILLLKYLKHPYNSNEEKNKIRNLVMRWSSKLLTNKNAGLSLKVFAINNVIKLKVPFFKKLQFIKLFLQSQF